MINALQPSTIQQLGNILNNTSEPKESEPAISDDFLGVLQASFQSAIQLDSPPQYTQNKNIAQGDVSNFVTSGEVNKSIKINYQELTSMINEALEDNGIEKYPTFEIFSDDNGFLYINSDRTDEHRIENILNNSREIRETFRKMSEDTAQAAAMERLRDFCNTYSANPWSGIQQQQDNPNNTESPNDTLSLQVGEYEYTPRLYSYGLESSLNAFTEIIANDFSDLEEKPTELETISL